MKVKRSGGGVDADGNVYKLPDEEIEVPDDYFKAIMQDMSTWEAPEFIMVSPEIFAQLKRRRS